MEETCSKVYKIKINIVVQYVSDLLYALMLTTGAGKPTDLSVGVVNKEQPTKEVTEIKLFYNSS